MILLIDNYDSFAHNLARYFRQLCQAVEVFRNDALTVDDVAMLQPSAMVLSPGPGTPAAAGICVPLVRELGSRIPVLGVCLGHQAICEAWGAGIARNTPLHGQASQIWHNGHPLFSGIESPFEAARYHSLAARPASLPDNLEVVAITGDDVVMAVVHRQYRVCGVQFHPESVLTFCGYRLLGNFLQWSGLPVDTSRVEPLTATLIRPAAPGPAERGPSASVLIPPPRSDTP
jgi:anthranilate synthase component 2